MKTAYQKPELTICEMEHIDVLTTSGDLGGSDVDEISTFSESSSQPTGEYNQ